jgi:hypothetical protein
MFKAILPALHRTGVPALLPGPGSLPIKKAYAATVFARSGSYEVLIGYVPNCMGHACELGTLDGWKLKAGASKPGGKAIQLTSGVTGYWKNYTCGANCGDATITLDQNGYRYVFGLHSGLFKAVLKMTTSALAAGPS